MFDFPSSPTTGQVYTPAGAGISYQWNGYAWATTVAGGGDVTAVIAGNGLTGGGMGGDLTLALQSPVSVANGGTGAVTAAAAPFVEIAGDTLTGPLILAADPAVPLGAATKAYADLKLPLVGGTLTGNLTIAPASGPAGLMLNKVPGEEAILYGMRNGVTRWRVNVADGASETGSNAGSNFDIQRHSDAGTFIDTPLSINRANGTMTITGSLWVQPVTTNEAGIYLNKPAAAVNSVVYGFRNGVVRWGLYLGNATAEGTNTGSDFALARFNDAGSYVENSILINRGNGTITLSAMTDPSGVINLNPGPSNSVVLQSSGQLTAPINAALKIGYPGGGVQYGISLRSMTDGTQALIFYNAANLSIGTISTNSTGTSYNTTSDARLKEDAQDFDAGPMIDATMVYDYAWISNGEREYGVVAQEAIEVYPQAVTHTVIPESENGPGGENWGVDYSKYVPLLLQEMKALRGRVSALEGAP